MGVISLINEVKKQKILYKIIIAVFCILFLHTSVYAKNSLKIALTGKYPPFSYYNETGELTGYDVDISGAIAFELGMDADIITTEWDGILAGLLSGKYDVIIGSMAITKQRKKKVNFTKPYYYSGAQLFVAQEYVENIKNIKDCYGKKIGVNLGETYEHYLRNKHPQIDVVTYKSTVDIFKDIKNKRIIGLVTDKMVGSWQIKKSKQAIFPIGKMLYKEDIAIPIKKSNPKLLKKINIALEKIEKKGIKQKIYDKYFTINNALKDETQANSSLFLFKILKGFAITLFVAIISLFLGFVVAIPTAIVLNSDKGIIKRITRFIVDFIRGTPVLIQLFFIYFGAPQIGIVLSPISSAIITLSINASAYMAEVIRSGLMSVPYGQGLAGRALGFSKTQIFVYIIWPQAFRIAIPSLVNSVIALTKDTALISIISVGEVIREAQSIISITFNPIKYYFFVAILFFMVTFPLMKLAGKLERNIKKKGFEVD